VIPRALVFAVGLGACAQLFSPIPTDAVLAAAEPLANLGHPNGTYTGAAIAGASGGSWLGGGSHDRYVDMDVFYDRKGRSHTMRVRFYVHETDPCRITTDVLSDDGPQPILLDNGLASQEVGKELCRALGEGASPAR
jgi:hypothetical protein